MNPVVRERDINARARWNVFIINIRSLKSEEDRALRVT